MIDTPPDRSVAKELRGDTTIITAKRLAPWRSSSGSFFLISTILAIAMTFFVAPYVIRDEWLFGRHVVAAAATMPLPALASCLLAMVAFRWARGQFTTTRFVIRPESLTIERQTLRRSTSLCIAREQLIDVFSQASVVEINGERSLTLKLKWIATGVEGDIGFTILSDRRRVHVLWITDEVRGALSLACKDPQMPDWYQALDPRETEPSSAVRVERTARRLRVTVSATSLRLLDAGRSLACIWVWGGVLALLAIPVVGAFMNHQSRQPTNDRWVILGLVTAFAIPLPIALMAMSRQARARTRFILKGEVLSAILFIGSSVRRYRWRRDELCSLQMVSGAGRTRALRILKNTGTATRLLVARSAGDIAHISSLLTREMHLPSRKDRAAAHLGRCRSFPETARGVALEYESSGPLGMSRQPGNIRFTEPPRTLLHALRWEGVLVTALLLCKSFGLLGICILLVRMNHFEVASKLSVLASIHFLLSGVPLLIAWREAGASRSVEVTSRMLRWQRQTARGWRERVWTCDEILAVELRHRHVTLVDQLGRPHQLMRARSLRAGRAAVIEMERALGLAPTCDIISLRTTPRDRRREARAVLITNKFEPLVA